MEELQRKEADCERQLKQWDSKHMLSRNKLTQLANYLHVFVAASFNMEQIIDAVT